MRSKACCKKPTQVSRFPRAIQIAPDVNVSAPNCGGAPTPEMYVGDWSGRGVLASPEGYRDHKTINYAPQNSVEDGRVVLSGRWETDKNGMIYRGKHTSNEPGEDRATLRYHAHETLLSHESGARARRPAIYHAGRQVSGGGQQRRGCSTRFPRGVLSSTCACRGCITWCRIPNSAATRSICSLPLMA